MLKASERVEGTKYFYLHEGNHNDKLDPHPQYLKKNNVLLGNNNVSITLDNIKIVTNYIEVTTNGLEGYVDTPNNLGFTSWCKCVGCTVELVDEAPTYIQLYYSNVYANKEYIRVMVKNYGSVGAGSKVRVSFILIGD